MADYTEQITAAQTAIREKGMPVTFVATEKGDYDPVTGGYVETAVRYETYAVRTKPNAVDIEAGIYTATSDLLLIAGGTIGNKRPDTTDYLEFNGHKWDVGNVVTVAPAEQDILYKVEVKDAGKL